MTLPTCNMQYITCLYFVLLVGQLSRLHMILKPFMLRRCKADVENEMAKKVIYDASCVHCVVVVLSCQQIVIQLMCELTPFQRKLYQGLRQRISLEDLLRSSSNLSHAPTSHLMNLVMQFRKVWLVLLHLIG